MRAVSLPRTARASDSGARGWIAAVGVVWVQSQQLTVLAEVLLLRLHIFSTFRIYAEMLFLNTKI